MSRSNILIVVVDGLRAASLGAYGNTIYPTPALDRFAAQSLLFDACYSPSGDLTEIYRALWASRHPLRAAAEFEVEQSLPRRARELGYETTFISDDQRSLTLTGASEFSQQLLVTADGGGKFAFDVPSLLQTFSSASEFVNGSTERNSPGLIWLHSKGFYGPWDAPLELQSSLLDEGDPPPVEQGDSPSFVISERGDPEAAFRYGCAYAAQAMLFDDCWQGLMESIRESKSEGDWLVMLLGARGFPLGEHKRIGGVDDRLHVEQLHVPWLIRFPDGRGRLSRRSQLTSHLDLLPTLVEWMGNGQESRVESREPEGDGRKGRATSAYDGASVLPLVKHSRVDWRESMLSAMGQFRSLRTAEWSLLEETVDCVAADDGRTMELYVRPDDRWEANNVASRCPDIVAELAQKAVDLAATIRTGDRYELKATGGSLALEPSHPSGDV